MWRITAIFYSPLIAKRRLAEADVVAVSPTAGSTCFADAQTPLAMRDLLAEPCSADAILIGGGYIVHDQPAFFLEEYRKAGVSEWAYPSLWLGATLIGSLRDIPVLWNAPGSPLSLRHETPQETDRTGASCGQLCLGA